MKLATFTGTDVEVQEHPRPKASRDLVVVQILAAPMCTEFKRRHHHEGERELGHEAVGVVVDAGSSQRVRIGDRVAVMPFFGCGLCFVCRSGDYMHCVHQRDVLGETNQAYGMGTYSQYILKPDWLLEPVPDDISLIHAAMACCGFGPTFGALERMTVGYADTLLVSGCGPVGLGAIAQGVTRNSRTFAIESHPYRQQLARDLGAECVLDPTVDDVPSIVNELTKGRGADAGIETSGAPRAAKTLAHSLRTRGRLSVVAWSGDVVLPPLVPLGLDVFGVWHWNNLHSAHEMWQTVRRARNLIDMLVTHVLPLSEVAKAMDIQASGECGKVILLPFPEKDDLVRQSVGSGL